MASILTREGREADLIAENPILKNGEVCIVIDKGTSKVGDGTTAFNSLAYNNISLLAQYNVTGSAITSVDFSGLDINTHNSYRVEMDLINATTSISDIQFKINNTATTYTLGLIYNNGATISYATASTTAITTLYASSKSKVILDISIVDNLPSVILDSIRGVGGGATGVAYNERAVLVSTTTATNITQLTIISTVNSSLAVGSKIRIYRGDT